MVPVVSSVVVGSSELPTLLLLVGLGSSGPPCAAAPIFPEIFEAGCLFASAPQAGCSPELVAMSLVCC